MINQPTAAASGAVTFETPLTHDEELARDKRKVAITNAELFVMRRFSLSRKELMMMRLALNGNAIS